MPKPARLALCQVWTESEKGWGQRPDGYSLHLTKEAHERYVRENWGNRDHSKGVPDEYSRPEGEPFLVEITPEQNAKLRGATNGIRLHGEVPARYVPTEKK